MVFEQPPSFDDERDVRIMWLWKALARQIDKENLTEQTRDEIMRDCFPDY